MKKSKTTSLFEIRLSGLDHDVVVIKGSADQASAVLLPGRIVLAVHEPLTVRRLSLRIYATLKLDFENERAAVRPRFERKLYEYVWDSAETSEYLNRLLHSVNDSAVGSAGFGSYGSTGGFGSAGSSTRGSAIFGSASPGADRHSHPLSALPSGNYEIPFSTFLPGTIPESVEGLPGAGVVYRIEATLDRGKFHNSLIATKHLRIIRTLTTDAVELSETVAVDNTWPQKVEYSLSVPARAIAIGSGTPVSCTLVPLMKGLRLGAISIQLVEVWSYIGILPPATNNERIVCESKIPASSEPQNEDTWQVDTYLNIPANLSQCTQDCDISAHLKVRHKLKFVLGLVNPDGHVSELRASLPVTLYISPFVNVDSEDENEENGPTVGSASSRETESNNKANQITGLMAPPVYENHIYDRLWSEVSPAESPIGSGSATPRYEGSMEDLSQFSMSPVDASYLSENLGRLSLERASSVNGEFIQIPGAQTPSVNVSQPVVAASPASAARATFNLGGDHDDYFSVRRPLSVSSMNHLFTNNTISPPTHLSRATSELDSTVLSKVPSYSQALKTDSLDEVLAPAYAPPRPGSNVNLAEVNRKFEEISKAGSSSVAAPRRALLSRGSSSISLKSMGRSAAVSPLQSRSVSSTSLRASGVSSTGSSSGNVQGLAAGAAPANGSTASVSSTSNVSKPSSSANDRNAAISPSNGLSSSHSGLSLHNLSFLHKKREK